MHWTPSTISVLRKLHDNDRYKKWNDTIKSGQIGNFSEELDDLLHRLAGICITEFEISPEEKDKLVKLLELAAIGGKTL